MEGNNTLKRGFHPEILLKVLAILILLAIIFTSPGWLVMLTFSWSSGIGIKLFGFGILVSFIGSILTLLFSYKGTIVVIIGVIFIFGGWYIDKLGVKENNNAWCEQIKSDSTCVWNGGTVSCDSYAGIVPSGCTK